MTVTMRTSASLTRRRFLSTAGATAATTMLGGIARPPLSRAADRPIITHGIQSGDVSVDSAIVWARSDRPARMLVEISTTDSFKSISHGAFVDALPATDFTAKALLQGLPAGQDIFYRLRFQDHASPTLVGEAQTGHFRTAPSVQRSVSFVWSGDTAGQGWGIDEARGGMRTFATMLKSRPDFFIHSGDSIYADCPIEAEQKLPHGNIWRNVVTEEKSKVAETLDEFRGNYKYNLIDRNVRAFNAEVPIFAQWTITKSPTTGARTSPSRPPRTANATSTSWRCAPIAPFTSSCRCARRWRRPAGSIAKFHMARCSTFSCSTCAHTARPSETARVPMRPAISSGRRRHPGSSAN
jgi:alkaline phosphatase D